MIQSIRVAPQCTAQTLLWLEQMPRDVHRCILGACLSQHVEEMQTAQRAGRFGSVKKSFKHSDICRNEFDKPYKRFFYKS
jgi:hypothetical protein